MTPVDDALVAERDFCLQSLRDLESERLAGDIDPGHYDVLRDSYTARAASALRAIEEQARGPVPSESAAPAVRVGVSRRFKGAVIGAVGAAVLAAGASWAVVASSGHRAPGQAITGQAVGSEAEAQVLQQAQQAATKGDTLNAIKDYESVLSVDPNQPQALTGAGWLLAQTQQPALLRQALGMLAKAEAVAPTFAPAHLYRGIALLSEDNYSDSIPELQWYLAHDPDPALVAKVRQALSQAEVKAGRR